MEGIITEPTAAPEPMETTVPRRRGRWWMVGGILTLFTILAVAVAVTWHFSSVVLVPDHHDWPLEVQVEKVKPGRIVLSRDDKSAQPGVYGLDWQTGHAIVGPVLSEADGTVTRRLGNVRGYLVPGIHVGLDSHVYSGDPRQGLPSLSISYRNDLGAPESPDGLYHLGQTEWVDLQAAVRYALAHGA